MIRIGPAGWDYADWQKTVYPAPIKGPDRLSFLSRLFPVIEINVTFYRPINAALAQRWIEAVAANPDFRFTAKLLQVFTHDRGEDAWQAESTVKAGLDPLLQHGVLGVLLAQFPYSFHNTQENRRYLLTLRQSFTDFPLAVEVRHRSWQRPEVRRFLQDHNLIFCNIDQPQVSYSLGSTSWVTGPLAYLRLHGRNRQAWFDKHGDQNARYNYLYTWEELSELAPKGQELATLAPETYLIFNNHPQGQAVINALEMIHLLTPDLLSLPDHMTTAFPRLASLKREWPSEL
jgi:uncharacterized protein YecE (DUF72 family)